MTQDNKVLPAATERATEALGGGGGRSSCFLAKQEVQRRESRRKSGDYEKDKFI